MTTDDDRYVQSQIAAALAKVNATPPPETDWQWWESEAGKWTVPLDDD